MIFLNFHIIRFLLSPLMRFLLSHIMIFLLGHSYIDRFELSDTEWFLLSDTFGNFCYFTQQDYCWLTMRDNSCFILWGICNAFICVGFLFYHTESNFCSRYSNKFLLSYARRYLYFVFYLPHKVMDSGYLIEWRIPATLYNKVFLLCHLVRDSWYCTWEGYLPTIFLRDSWSHMWDLCSSH